jgi:fluoride exporter
MQFLWVALGGAIGSTARYSVNISAARLLGGGFPWATLIVNVLGCFAMGIITALLRSKMPDDENTRLFLTTGLLGGFTTFSAFSLDFFGLLQRGEMPSAIAYAAASVVLSIMAVIIGFKAFG